MAFDNSRNQARARNIANLLEHVQVSAAANHASPAQVAEVLAPALQALAALGLQGGTSNGQEQTGSDAAGHDTPDLTAGQRAALALADRASLRDLIAALIGRLEHHQAKIGGGQ